MPKFLLAFVTGVLLTIVFTWPFALNLASYYTDQGDYATHGSIFWWNQDSIKTGRILSSREYFQGYQFYPQPYSLAFANNSVFPGLVFAPIFWLTGSLPFSFNLYIFGTFVASFVAAFYTVKYFISLSFKTTRDNGLIYLSSLVGASIYAFNAQTLTRFPHHVDILGKFALPLIFLFAYKAFDRPTFKNAFFLSLLFTINSLTTNYFQIFSIVFLPLVFAPFLIANLKKKNWGYFLDLAKTSLLGFFFLPIILYFNLPFWDFSQREGASRSIDESIFFSARVADWFAPTTNNFLYGGWAKTLEKVREPKDNRGILNYEEHTLFLGILPLALFILGLKYWWNQKVGRAYLLIILVGSFLFIFGPFLGAREDGVKLPFYYLYELVPIMKGMRAPTRFEYVFFIPFSVIASWGAIKLLRWLVSGKDKLFLAAGFLLLVLSLENFTVKDFVTRSAVFNKLDSLGEGKMAFLKNKIVFHLPIYTISDADVFGNNSYSTNWATRTGERVVNGNSGFFPADQLSFLFGAQDNFNEEALRKLLVLGVNYVVFHKDLMPPAYESALFEELQGYEDKVVFEDVDITIVDLGKYNFPFHVCSFPQDFNVRVTEDQDLDTSTSYALILRNKSNCYLPSIYWDRYRHLVIEIDGQKRTAELKLPLLVEPGEQIILNEMSKELRIR